MMTSSSSPRPQNVPAELSYPRRQPAIGEVLQASRRRAVDAPRSLVSAALFALFFALVVTLLSSEHALAQAPRNFRIPPYVLPDVESSEAEADAAALPDSPAAARKVIVDTDPGVDDAAALIWLFTQDRYEVDVLGVVTVAGNSTITNTTNNAGLILDWLGVSTPLIRGADGPLLQSLTLVQWLIHGPDGLWSPLYPDPTPEAIPDSVDAPAFYCEQLALETGVLVLALGPLTNIALAIEACPTLWQDVEIVSLGGGKFMSNQTPVTEFNYWQDPEAAAKVVSHSISSEALAFMEGMEPISPTLQIVPVDSFAQFEIQPSTMRQIEKTGGPAIQNLLPALMTYDFTFSSQGEASTLPDVSAAIYALDNRLGTAQSAQVEVLAGVPEVARGQSVIGLTFIEKIVMIAGDAGMSALTFRIFNEGLTDEQVAAEMGAILFSRPDNAMVVTDIDARRMHTIFLQGLRQRRATPTSEGPGVVSEMEDYENHLFVPFASD
ncbi:MAG: nucleoside hydrolase [Caldilineaceae bacterium]|nr:nucleoside hydrolase [Caldilineaceae bacterium]